MTSVSDFQLIILFLKEWQQIKRTMFTYDDKFFVLLYKK